MSAVAVEDFERWRPALTGHCYRMLGSVADAEDAVQEALLRAWQQAAGFRGDASVQTWLHAIATHVCLDMLKAKRRRHRPVDTSPQPAEVTPALELTARPHEHWVEPIPDALALPAADDPAERAILRESIRLAFVAALQYLPPKQRAALLLTEVLSWTVAETASCLGTTPAAINSALQRARATLDARNPAVVPRELSAAQRQLVDRYAAAFERYDVDALAALLQEDATMSMPPYDLWLRGRASIAGWLRGHGAGCAGSRLVPVAACGGTPAFAQYRDRGAQPWAIVLLEFDGDAISSMTSYLDTGTLFPRFGLPSRLE